MSSEHLKPTSSGTPGSKTQGTSHEPRTTNSNGNEIQPKTLRGHAALQDKPQAFPSNALGAMFERLLQDNDPQLQKKTDYIDWALQQYNDSAIQRLASKAGVTEAEVSGLPDSFTNAVDHAISCEARDLRQNLKTRPMRSLVLTRAPDSSVARINSKIRENWPSAVPTLGQHASKNENANEKRPEKLKALNGAIQFILQDHARNSDGASLTDFTGPLCFANQPLHTYCPRQEQESISEQLERAFLKFADHDAGIALQLATCVSHTGGIHIVDLLNDIGAHPWAQWGKQAFAGVAKESLQTRAFNLAHEAQTGYCVEHTMKFTDIWSNGDGVLLEPELSFLELDYRYIVDLNGVLSFDPAITLKTAAIPLETEAVVEKQSLDLIGKITALFSPVSELPLFDPQRDGFATHNDWQTFSTLITLLDGHADAPSICEKLLALNDRLAPVTPGYGSEPIPASTLRTLPIPHLIQALRTWYLQQPRGQTQTALANEIGHLIGILEKRHFTAAGISRLKNLHTALIPQPLTSQA
ncbi:hypothetical protein [Paraburkholderia hayleyella]|uniref:hypothetical protein n=1 Tax=Paraburkholderia hayleyella TaxID=2152889 RepID=UPI001290B35C|nr:hypothetical protein [Paraburkholderia hayleyella]